MFYEYLCHCHIEEGSYCKSAEQASVKHLSKKKMCETAAVFSQPHFTHYQAGSVNSSTVILHASVKTLSDMYLNSHSVYLLSMTELWRRQDEENVYVAPSSGRLQARHLQNRKYSNFD